MTRTSRERPLHTYDLVGIEEGKFVFVKNNKGKPVIVEKNLKRFLYFASGALLLSGIIDAFLWVTTQYMVPCWTVALISVATGVITLSLTSVKFLFSR